MVKSRLQHFLLYFARSTDSGTDGYPSALNAGESRVARGAAAYAFSTLNWLAAVWVWSNVFCDIIISSLLWLSLWLSRADVPIENATSARTDALIISVRALSSFPCWLYSPKPTFQLMRLSFETALLTSLTALVAAVC